MTTKTRPTRRYACCPSVVGDPHAEDCPACREVEAQDADHRAYLDATPDAYEHTHGPHSTD